jgi:ParB-like chromosome segregation protein Spo0J
MKIETLSTASLVPYARNAKKHDANQVAKLAGSIREFGFNNPVLIDKDNGIIAGHGRVMAAQSLGLETVPCIRLGHLTDTQRRAYILADNRLAEIGGGWDEEMLKLELADLAAFDLDVAELGFEAESLKIDADDLSITDGFSETSEQSTGLADVVFSFGQYRFPVERNVFLQWQENIRQGVGFSDLEVQGEIKKRMKL